MTIEHSSTRMVEKPRGSTDLRPWNQHHRDGTAIGELWFQRSDPNAPDPALLLKLLFTTEPLSLQVHPDDAFARSVGLDHGKTEAWYVLSAAAGARVATGLKLQITTSQLRVSIEDGSIADLVQWRRVVKDDIVFIPAGTIYSIGPGLVLAEIQQRSDVTYRLFDYGRHRELQVDNAVSVADVGPAEIQPVQVSLSDSRTLLVANSYFVLERVEFSPGSRWEIDAKGETWFLVLEGQAQVGLMQASIGQAIFLEGGRAGTIVGSGGLKGLVAYLGPDIDAGVLHHHDGQIAACLLDHRPQPMQQQGTGTGLREVQS